MLTTPETPATRGWLRFGGAILFLLLAAGCSPAGPTASGPATSASVPPTATSTAPSSPVASSSAAAQLQAALQPLRVASSYETVVAVDGATVVTAEGRTVGDASDATVTTAGRTVEYIQIPPKAWAREAGGTWVLITADQAPGAPLDVLAEPLTLQVGETAAGESSFTATYPAAALGLQGDPLTVTISVKDDGVTFRYEASNGGRATSSTTTIRPAAADPITAPTP